MNRDRVANLPLGNPPGIVANEETERIPILPSNEEATEEDTTNLEAPNDEDNEQETNESLQHWLEEMIEYFDVDDYWPTTEQLEGLHMPQRANFPVPKPTNWKEDTSDVSIAINKSRVEQWGQCK